MRWGCVLMAGGLLIGGLPAACASAGVIRHDRNDSQYTALAASPQYASVGRIGWNEPSGSFLASGVLISSEWVLTAAHVVGGTDDRGAGITNLTFTAGGQSRLASDWIPHPSWATTGGANNLFAGWDLGLVRLGAPILTATTARVYTGSDELGEVATAVGFGATGDGNSGATGPSGTKRAGNNTIDVVGATQTPGSNPAIRFGHDRLLAVDFDEPGAPASSSLGGSAPLDLEYLSAPGDSGGGLFIDVGGETVVAGITSLVSSTDGDGANSDYADRAAYSRVSAFLGWIESTTGLSLTGPPLEGDYNGDGAVDGVDYFLWRTQNGSVGAGLGADGNGDGRVDGADYTIWREGADAFSSGSAFAAGVPEPSTAVLATIVMGAWASRARRASRDEPAS